ncbi:UNVERIFIED_CONTAM: hypothetical protein PYX00_005822 [Menopon gallinae]|uniref:Uncharacterized protein n=1 Tax=Menopon gallinae TaxID=328185 RepID=A0AAW2HUT9_9NEOP
MDTVYPEPLSRLYRRAVRKNIHKNNSGRYRTQPVTFAEIQEVDEESITDEVPEKSAAAASKSELDLKAKFEEFKRQRDRDLWESERLASKGRDCASPTEEKSFHFNGGNSQSGSGVYSSLFMAPSRGNSSFQRPSV